jgi:malate dehydrogenase
LKIRELAQEAVVVIVTNPLDLMTHLAAKALGFKHGKVFGMGVSLDASRLANLIAEELKVLPTDVEAWVIGSHGEAMLPLPKHSKVKGKKLDELLTREKLQELSRKTVGRGAEIVSLLGSGSAYFAPSAAIAQIVQAVVKDEKKVIGACVALRGEYGLKDVSLGVPCRIGRQGVIEVVEFSLDQEEKERLAQSAQATRELAARLAP